MLARLEPKLAQARDAFARVAGAVEQYAQVVYRAQSLAQGALQQFDQAVVDTENWVESNVPVAGEVLSAAARHGLDPGDPIRAAAEWTCHQAQALVDAEAAVLLEIVVGVAALAPTAAALVKDVADAGSDVMRAYEWLAKEEWHFAEGVWDGTVGGIVTLAIGIAKFSWSVSPLRYLLDPTGWHRSVDHDIRSILTVGEFAVSHPAEFAKDFGKALVDWDEWKKDPARALGSVVGSVALAVASFGTAGAAEGAVDAANAGEKTAETLTAAERAAKVAETSGDVARSAPAVDGAGGRVVSTDAAAASRAADAASAGGDAARTVTARQQLEHALGSLRAGTERQAFGDANNKLVGVAKQSLGHVKNDIGKLREAVTAKEGPISYYIDTTYTGPLKEAGDAWHNVFESLGSHELVRPTDLEGLKGGFEAVHSGADIYDHIKKTVDELAHQAHATARH